MAALPRDFPMLSPLVLIVLVLAPPPPPAVQDAFEVAATEVLGDELQLRVEQLDSAPSDDAVLARLGDAAGIVELSWSDAPGRVVVHCYLAEQQRWLRREISFDASDPLQDRGRLLGFAVASMFAGDPIDAGDAPSSGASEVLAPDPPPPAQAAQAATAAAERQATNPDQPPRATPRTDSAVTSRRDLGERSLEFAGIGSFGIGGTARGLGAGLGLRVAIASPVWARAGLSARTGEIPRADASTLTALAGAGLGVDLTPRRSTLSLSVRTDLLAGWFTVSHFSDDDSDPTRQGRALVGADLLATATYPFADTAAVSGSVGLESMLGSTEIFTHGERVATVPILRGIAEIGLRTEF